MRKIIRCFTVLTLCSTSAAWANGIVRIADGNCAGLAAAASSSGPQPSLIILARNGHYSGCSFEIAGNIVIDGAGASLSAELLDSSNQPSGFSVHVEKGASLTLRNLNIEGAAHASTAVQANAAKPNIVSPLGDAFFIEGSLLIDSVSIASNTMDYLPSPLGYESGGLFYGGDLTLRNVTIASNVSQQGDIPLFDGAPNITISNSTIVNNDATVFSGGTVSISNSILSGNGHGCLGVHVTSLGGNVTDDAGCGLNAANDRVVADGRLLDLDRHGGVVKNVALRNDSPAIGNGIVGNCEGTDSRGFSRGLTACDAGAYEFGGGIGKISAAGMSGLYFNPSNDGHYVSIQRLQDDTALVIWNTFDENGVPAWLYGVGSIAGQSIHVDQVARNTGGKLLPGGDVVGSHAAVWGSIDVNLSDCVDAQLSYHSKDPEFGSGSTTLQRLAYLDNVNCAR
ncbi:MAG TPA: choice-of-anchor Q domain-containing protein [Rudaea sp.]|jgi:hypothetical protein|nr:choice-of-anchor Q domain-containing protein [Rudaea sp.]